MGSRNVRGKRRIRSGCIFAEALESRRLLTTIYVDAHATSATHNGVTWNTAYTDLQQALTASVSGDTIRVADGTYKPGSGTITTVTYQLKTGVTLQGGYAGFGATNPNARDIVANRTILDGLLSTTSSASFQAQHVVTGSGTNSTAVLDGFTVRDGFGSSGGGIYNVAGSPTISNCVIESNTASTSGGGMYNSASSPTISNCTFLQNAAPSGGGIYDVSSSSPSISNCLIAGNFTGDGNGSTAQNGGGMANDHSSPVVLNSQFSENYAVPISGSGGGGGGIYNTNSAAPSFTNCTINRNEGALGGGVANTSFSLPVYTGCTFSDNQALAHTSGNYEGGAIYNAAAARFVNCSITNNTAANLGGGMFSYSTPAPTLINCLFNHNSALTGGGVYCSGSSPNLTNCTFTANSGTGEALYKGGTVSPLLVNCIAWGNIGTAPTAIINGTTSTALTVSNSDIQGGWAGSGNINLDPVFANAAGADGIVGNADDDLHIRASSPAVDAGDNTASGLSGITTDFAGNARFVDVIGAADTGVGTAPIVDMGAYEAAAGMDADAFGPYRVAAGGTIPLTSYGYSDQAGTLSFAWDLDGDGKYDDATGPSPTFSAAGITGATTITIGVQITDSANHTKTDSATLKVIPSVMYVDDSAVGTNNGGTWTNAYTSLQSAMLDAVPGTEIRVAQGTYKPTTGIDWWTSFDLKSGISLIGGYAGVGAANPDARDYNANPTILSGDIGLPGDSSDNTNQIVTVHGADSTAIIDGFTITQGNSWGIIDNFAAGGMEVYSGSPTIRNCRFLQNQASGSGGGLLDNASGTITNCVFQGNLAGTGGGGAFIGSISESQHDPAPTFTDCSFIGNMAFQGGALELHFANPSPNPRIGSFINCTFSGNRAAYSHGGPGDGQGAAIYILNGGSSPILTNCILWGNTIGQSSTAQAQIYPSNASVTATYCDIQTGGNAGVGNINVDPLFVQINARRGHAVG